MPTVTPSPPSRQQADAARVRRLLDALVQVLDEGRQLEARAAALTAERDIVARRRSLIVDNLRRLAGGESVLLLDDDIYDGIHTDATEVTS